jgi:hypothetical protein
MDPLRFAALCTVGVGLLLPANTVQKNASHLSEYPAPQVREEQSVIVNGVTETWQLRWVAPPKLVCGPNEISMSTTCPCMGFAYGEGGDLDLTRLRNGSEIDRLHITPLFEEQLSHAGRAAIIQRWPTDDEKDVNSGEEDLSRVVKKRPIVQVMHFFDYDHDGEPTEFYLQSEAAPCGKSVGVVVGISKSNPRLHAFGTFSDPDKPLHLQRREWEALRDAQGAVDVLDWACRDHASETQTTLSLRWTAQGIGGTRREFACTPESKPGELLHEEPL